MIKFHNTTLVFRLYQMQGQEFIKNSYPGPSKGFVDVKQVEVADVVQRGEDLFLHYLGYACLHSLQLLCSWVDLMQEGIYNETREKNKNHLKKPVGCPFLN